MHSLFPTLNAVAPIVLCLLLGKLLTRMPVFRGVDVVTNRYRTPRRHDYDSVDAVAGDFGLVRKLSFTTIQANCVDAPKRL